MQTSEEESGVDGASDRRGHGHSGDDGDAGDVAHIAVVETAAHLAEHDHAIRTSAAREYDTAQRDVARASQHDQVNVAVAGEGDGPGVDDADLRVADGLSGEREPVGHATLALRRFGDTQQGGRGRQVGGYELRADVAGGVDGKGGGDSAGSLAATGSVEDHVEGAHRYRLLR